jgi:E3 ubiquitin-protein ligase MYCBP2
MFQEYSKIACERILECGHLCGGVRNETKCLPCLQGCSDKLGTILKQDGDDMCMICFTDALAFAPAIQVIQDS